MSQGRRFDIHRLYGWIFKLWRERRFRLFLDVIQPRATDALVDVGGYPANWAKRAPVVGSIDCINLEDIGWRPERLPDHRIRALVADGRSLPFAENAYDIAYSNSVIEHVGSWDDQRRFAREILRVAGAVWVQTPAYECPIEPHYLLPFVHYLPRSMQKRIVRFSIWGLLERPSPAKVAAMVDTTRLLRRKEMAELFPGCEIMTERLFLVFPKSYIAVRRQASARERISAPSPARTTPATSSPLPS
jgi:hypothetical protein